MKLPCGCLVKEVTCICMWKPHGNHRIYVSPCADQEHVKRIGSEVVDDDRGPNTSGLQR